MIQATIRKHRNLFAAVVFGPIILSFVLWGGFGSSSKKRGSEQEDPVGPVAVVGDIPISSFAFREQLNNEIRRRGQFGQSLTFKDLALDGTVERVLENLVNGELLQWEAERDPMMFDRKFLVEKLKEDPTFQDESGNFDPKAWNEWLDANPDINWNAMYESIQQQLRRYLVQQRITASARVRESELRKKFEEEQTKLKVKFTAVEPPIVPTPEQVQAQYDEDPMAYALPEERVAEFAAISLAPPKPKLVDEVLQRARDGEDFAKLAETYSDGPNKAKGGDLGWLSSEVNLPEHQKGLVDLEVGQVSDTAEGPGGYYIFKVEEDRKSESTDAREVHARQIQIRPALTEEEREARKAEAEALAAAAKEKSLAEAAEEAGLSVQTTSQFSIDSLSVDPLPPEDARRFRMAISNLAESEISDVVDAPKGLYVARVTKLVPPVEQPFEAVQERVKEDAIEAIRRSPDYILQVTSLADEIAEKASSLAQLQEAFPELDVKVEESPEFSIKDYDYAACPQVRPRELFDAIGDKGPGGFAGPLMDYFGRKAYFVELVEKNGPTEADWEEKWPEEEKKMRDAALTTERRKRIEDYLQDRREQGLWRRNDMAIAEVLGLNEPEPEEPTEPEEAPAVVKESSAEAGEAAPAEDAAEAAGTEEDNQQ